MNYNLKIEQDEYSENPRESFDNFGKLVMFHKRYSLPNEIEADQGDYNSWAELEAALFKDHGAVVVLPVYMYDHSGLALSTAPFSCRWDSGQVGFIFADRDSIMREGPKARKYLTSKLKAWARGILESEVETYGMYVSGDVWEYAIEDEDGEVIEACCGYYGYDYCLEQGQAALSALTSKVLKQTDLFEEVA